jgi:hypothetical protein
MRMVLNCDDFAGIHKLAVEFGFLCTAEYAALIVRRVRLIHH